LLLLFFLGVSDDVREDENKRVSEDENKSIRR
jgi:hypothetical protein